MRKSDIIRAWKDPAYREGLSAEQRAGIAEHPAGRIELSDTELDEVSGGIGAGGFLTSWYRDRTEQYCCDIFGTGTKYCTKQGPKCPQPPIKR
jgi:mersacidin/lichenicidin family type 2 lantibiotic